MNGSARNGIGGATAQAAGAPAAASVPPPAPAPLPAPVPATSVGVDALIEATRQEIARADAKSAALLTVVGIGFTAFSVAGASVVAVPLHGAARWLSLVTLTGVCVVAELLLFVLRPVLRKDDVGQLYFATWRSRAPEQVARELSADVVACRILVRLSGIVWQKYRLTRWAVHVMSAVLPLMAVSLAVALLTRP